MLIDAIFKELSRPVSYAYELSRSVMFDSLRPSGVHQTLLSMGFSRQEYWSGLPFPPPGDLPDLGIEPMIIIYIDLYRSI